MQRKLDIADAMFRDINRVRHPRPARVGIAPEFALDEIEHQALLTGIRYLGVNTAGRQQGIVRAGV